MVVARCKRPELTWSLDVAAQHGHLARIEVEQLGRGLHIAGDVHLVGQEMRLVEKLRALGRGCAGQTRVHLDCAGLLGIPQVHQVADVAAADLDAGKAIAQGRQITRRLERRLRVCRAPASCNEPTRGRR